MASNGSTAGYQVLSLEEHARTKGMWAGAISRTTIPNLQGIFKDPPAEPEGGPGYRLEPLPRDHTPALLKIVDEGLVNASDHQREHAADRRQADRVTRIALDFDATAAQFVIENDGPGIPIVVHEQATQSAGRTVYVPEVAFGMFLAGRNMEKPPDCVKGGINGIGGKLINVHSDFFEIKTCENGQIYTQVFRDRKKVREEPVIRRVAKSTRPYTRVTFRPAWAELGYAPSPTAEDVADLAAWCRWRMFLLAAYVGPKVSVTFNGERCPTTSAAALAGIMCGSAAASGGDAAPIIRSATLKATQPPYKAHPWDVAVVLLPAAARFGHLSVVNGVHCAKGTHVNYLKKTLHKAIETKLRRASKAKNNRITPSDTCKHLFVVMVGAIPGADWGGQRKDELQMSEARLAAYRFPPRALGEIADLATEALLGESERGRGGRRRRVDADKYTGARRAGTRDSPRCFLLAAEGDSACALLRAGLTCGPKVAPGGPTFERYGIFSLGGVIMNAMKKVNEVGGRDGGDTILVRSEALRNNKVLNALVEILGLDFTCRYESEAEVARLRYGGIIICTDQDLDGTGKILCLVLVWFHLFWPALIRRGFVRRFVTPVVRAYGRRRTDAAGEVHEFPYEAEFRAWWAARAAALGGEAKATQQYEVKYYKGLAAHDDGEEVSRMFRDFDRAVHTFTLDDSAAELFDVYFGPRPALRKAALATPVAYLSYEEARAIHESRLVPCSTQLRVDAKAYKLDDLSRKIPGVADGIPVARRKILAGALRRFGNSNAAIKVFQLGGYVAEHLFYHHGEASLGSTIIGMAQRFPGALNFPYLSGIGQFGTRHEGGSDAGSPRYVSVCLAAPYARAMLPARDLKILPHVFEDGERAQPQYFVPVLPAALLESFDIPSEGWRHRSFAREFADVLALTRGYVRGDPLVLRAAADFSEADRRVGGAGEALAGVPAETVRAAVRGRYPLRTSLRGYGEHLPETGRADLIRPYKGVLHSFGCYEVINSSATTIRVVELPIRRTTAWFLKNLQRPTRARLIEDVDNYSSKDGIDIRVRLRPGAWGEVLAKYGDRMSDPVEDFLLLRTSLQPYLNYYGTDGRVLEFDSDYHAVFFSWAPLRRALYEERLWREETILRLKIKLEEATVRYLTLAAELDLGRAADEAAAVAVLAARGFPRLDAGLLRSPGYTPADELEILVTEGVNISYEYLLGLPQRALVEAARRRREARIAELQAERARTLELLAERPFAGASVWAAELDAVEAAVAQGEKTNWRFG